MQLSTLFPDEASTTACFGFQAWPDGQVISPYIRGNPAHRNLGRARRGSIPACTGEPGPRTPWWGFVQGLSPVSGGTIQDRGPIFIPEGPIPACTGEPAVPDIVRGQDGSGLSPRVRGNHPCHLRARLHDAGLSPRVRGNHWETGSRSNKAVFRSIPACTGEPLVIADNDEDTSM